MNNQQPRTTHDTTVLRQTKIIFRRREKVKQPSCSLLTRGKRQTASKTLPETSTQGLSNDLFWDPPVYPPQATAKLSRPQRNSGAGHLHLSLPKSWWRRCFRWSGQNAASRQSHLTLKGRSRRNQKQRKSLDPPGRLAIYFVTPQPSWSST